MYTSSPNVPPSVLRYSFMKTDAWFSQEQLEAPMLISDIQNEVGLGKHQLPPLLTGG